MGRIIMGFFDNSDRAFERRVKQQNSMISEYKETYQKVAFRDIRTEEQNYQQEKEHILVPDFEFYPNFLDVVDNSRIPLSQIKKDQAEKALKSVDIKELRQLLGSNFSAPQLRFLNQSYERYWAWVRSGCELYMLYLRGIVFQKSAQKLIKEEDPNHTGELNRQKTYDFHRECLAAFEELKNKIKNPNANDGDEGIHSWIHQLLLSSKNEAMQGFDMESGARTRLATYLSPEMLIQYFIDLIDEQINVEKKRLELNEDYRVTTALAPSYYYLVQEYKTKQKQMAQYGEVQQIENEKYRRQFNEMRTAQSAPDSRDKVQNNGTVLADE